MAELASERIPERRLNLGLWTGLLAGPLAWFLDLQMSYALTETACSTGRQWLLHLVSLACLLLVVLGGLIAEKQRRRLFSGADDSTSHGDVLATRSRFMALCGVVQSAFFVLVILATWIPSWIVGACAH